MSEPPKPNPKHTVLPELNRETLPLQSPPLPPVLPPLPLTRRRRPVSRACDRCRRRKARCDYFESAKCCTLCREAEVQCTFDLPLARRGPKAKKRRDSSAAPPLSPLVDGAPDSRFSTIAPPLRPSDDQSQHRSFVVSAPSSTTAWEGEHRGVSPRVISDSVTFSCGQPNVSAFDQWNRLSKAPALHQSLEHTISRCLALFFEYLYPLTPLVHEQSLRNGVEYFVTQAKASAAHLSNASWRSHPPPFYVSRDAGPVQHSPEAAFTLITAVCAEAAFLLPKELFPEGESIAETFLRASRSCLFSYLEADLDKPTASSITIRYFHSNCVHAEGKPKYSWHIFGEATRLAQIMQLHEESSFTGLSPVEAELRRRVFYIVSMGDKSAAILNTRPITIHKYSFENGITTLYPTGIEGETAATSPDSMAAASDPGGGSFIEGFNANLRLWQAAADILLEIRLLKDRRQSEPGTQSNAKFAVNPTERDCLDKLHIRFITCLDHLPPYLQSSSSAAAIHVDNNEVQSTQHIIQCTNLQISFHCLRMMITEKFEDIAYFAPGAEQSDLRKTEIVRDMLRVTREAEFWAQKVNGEPYVEKIRLIGASLLAIIHRNGDSPLGMRARGDFSVLLDILTRLDSKASDALRGDSAWSG